MIKRGQFGWRLLLLAAACSVAMKASEITATVHINQPPASYSLANVVVWLNPIDGHTPHPIPRQNLRLVQKNKEFTPHLLVVPTGSSIDFPNLDPFFHNVFSLFNGKRFDLGLYESGGHRNVTFDREGVSYIFCNIHPEMGAVVIALDSPYFGISNAKGMVVLHDVPKGRYRVQVWSEQLVPDQPSTADRIIDVTSDSLDLGQLDFKSSNVISTHHKNKFGKDYPPQPTSAY